MFLSQFIEFVVGSGVNGSLLFSIVFVLRSCVGVGKGISVIMVCVSWGGVSIGWLESCVWCCRSWSSWSWSSSSCHVCMLV
jgi:hypothetical protein